MSTPENWTAEDELRQMNEQISSPGAGLASVSWPRQTEIMRTALRALADKQAEIEQLTEELASWRGRDLQNAMERDMAQIQGTQRGDLLRTTDTHKTFEWTGDDSENPWGWVQREDHPA
jgi:hypothetical protein